jgi:hypothetical protein
MTDTHNARHTQERPGGQSSAHTFDLEDRMHTAEACRKAINQALVTSCAGYDIYLSPRLEDDMTRATPHSVTGSEEPLGDAPETELTGAAR